MDQNMDTPNPTPENQPSPQSEYDASSPPTPQQPAPQAETPSAGEAISQDSKNMGMLCHLLGLFTNFLGPLILWLIKKEEDVFVDEQGKESLNFQITIALAGIASAVLAPVFCIGIILGIATTVCNLVFCILASIAASKGEHYRYPVCLRLVK